MKQHVPTPLIALALLLLALNTAFASQTHETPGNQGPYSHNPGTHPSNPAHAWIKVLAPGTGNITSGGRYHDQCNGTYCTPAEGGDYAIDIGAAGGSQTKLYIDYDGMGSGSNPAIDTSKNIRIKAKAVDSGNWGDTGTEAACYWQQFDILASYWPVGGGPQYINLVVGSIWVGHQYNWQYDEDDPDDNTVFTNAQRTLGGGGTVYYINAKHISNVYQYGDPDCSGAAHTHWEVLSDHAWGREYEWHAEACTATSQDGYSGLYQIQDHQHCHISSYGPTDTLDSVTQGSHIIGWIGGSSTNFRMSPNPYNPNH